MDMVSNNSPGQTCRIAGLRDRGHHCGMNAAQTAGTTLLMFWHLARAVVLFVLAGALVVGGLGYVWYASNQRAVERDQTEQRIVNLQDRVGRLEGTLRRRGIELPPTQASRP